MKRPYIAFSAMLCLALLTLGACTTLGLETPRDLPERVAYVTAGTDAVVVAAVHAVGAGSLSSADAQYISTAGRQLSALIAAAASDPDPRSAEGRLALAEGILKQLQAYVASHQKVSK